MPAFDLFSIGHSNIPAERFLVMLQNAGVNAVADVRSMPYSRRLPWFSQKTLAASLSAAGGVVELNQRLIGCDLPRVENWCHPTREAPPSTQNTHSRPCKVDSFGTAALDEMFAAGFRHATRQRPWTIQTRSADSETDLGTAQIPYFNSRNVL